MPLLRLAIVGRPNVGKSSITNMLAGRKVSITDDTPGTTRDRVSTVVTLTPPDGPEEQAPLQVELTDTGGYGVYTRAGGRFDDAGKDLSSLTRDIEDQIAKAVHQADLILFVIDTQAGVNALDETVARLLREGGLGAVDEAGHASDPAGSRVIVVANKTDGPKWENHAYEGSALGFGEPLMVGAKNNYRRREFVERLHQACTALIERRNKPAKKKARKGKAGASAEQAEAAPIATSAELPEMKLAIVGKRNAGKSTLVNTLAGEQRVIVSEIAGTTRDAIDVRFTMDGRSFLAIDTAGLRRKKSFDQRIEWWALERMERAIDRCDVALMMVDATEPISQVDQQVGQMLEQRYRPCIIVVNKWDLVEGTKAKNGKPVTTEDYEQYLRKELKGLWFAPIAFISAKDNQNIKATIELAFELMQQSRARVGTGVLNRLLRSVLERQGPSTRSGTFAKVYYTSQIEIDPPTLVMVVNKPDMFTPQYRRFLLNRLREETPFSEVPIKLVIKGRSQRAKAADDETLEALVQQAAQVESAARAEQGRAGLEPDERELDLLDASAYFDEPGKGGADAGAREGAPSVERSRRDAEEQLDLATRRKQAPKAPRKAGKAGKTRPKSAEAKARAKKHGGVRKN
jgi:GTP-binding protein